ncbi:hypothetical protein ACMFMF_003353 [Clarireedia jacksonii]
MDDSLEVPPSFEEEASQPLVQTDNVSHTEPSALCPICLSPFEDRAIVQPCGHPFDLKCIRAWLDQSGPNARNCPLCRRRMTELQYDIPGGRVIELIRPVCTYSGKGAYAYVYMLLKVTQRRSMWTEVLAYSSYKKDSPRRVCFSEINGMTDDTAADTVSLNYAEAAMKELRMTLNRWWNECQNIDIARVEVTLNSCEVFTGRRGIHSFLKEKVSIEHGSQETYIRWEMVLEEDGPANADDDPQIFHPDTQTPERARADQRIRRAEEQIQGAHEWFMSHGFVDREGPSLERATTNIREVPDMFSLCDFCSVSHRYGDCLMDWRPREPPPE